MWDCGRCGCRAIAPGILFCPQCFKEREMPKSVTGAVPSNQHAADGEVGHIAPDADSIEVTEAVGSVQIADAKTPAKPAVRKAGR